jgi:arginine-tRNA-protein transferase
MVVLSHYFSSPERCAYLPQEQSRLEYLAVAHISPEEYEAKMNSGWRKFGLFLFRPKCLSCFECRPIRVLVDSFYPNRSQKRVLRDNADLRVVVALPRVDQERLTLYRRYHGSQAERKGWDWNGKTAQEYERQFVQNPIPALEISVWEGERLRAVALNDLTPNVVSGIYHYHDPDCRERGLGTFTLLQIIALARQLGKPYAYFGFYVAGCNSMNYKARYRPCEILDAQGEWQLLK